MKLWMAVAVAFALNARQRAAQEEPKPGSIAGTVTQVEAGGARRERAPAQMMELQIPAGAPTELELPAPKRGQQ